MISQLRVRKTARARRSASCWPSSSPSTRRRLPTTSPRFSGQERNDQSARQQADAYEQKILKAARESERLVREAYAGGDPKLDYNALLEAQRTLILAQIGEVQARGDMWRAVSEIVGLLQPDGDCCVAAPR